MLFKLNKQTFNQSIIIFIIVQYISQLEDIIRISLFSNLLLFSKKHIAAVISILDIFRFDTDLAKIQIILIWLRQISRDSYIFFDNIKLSDKMINYGKGRPHYINNKKQVFSINIITTNLMTKMITAEERGRLSPTKTMKNGRKKLIRSSSNIMDLKL